MGRTQKKRNVVEVGNIQLSFLSEKTDNFQNELVYFAVSDKDWKTKLRFIQAIADGNKRLKVPYFMGDQGHPILRVKKKFIGCVDFQEFQPTTYTADLVFEFSVLRTRKPRNLPATIVRYLAFYPPARLPVNFFENKI